MQSWVSYKSSILCDVEFGLCLCESVVVIYLLRCELTVWGSMLWFEQWSKWQRWLILSWHVVLKSAQDQILGVDIPGQHVPPRVRYGMTCLLIRNTIGSVLLGWVGNDIILCESPYSHGARGPFVGKTLALQAGPFVEKTITKHDILL
jgi:hypothetical protein